MDIKELIHNPERFDRETLYELRSIVALYPYFQTARLLMLQNMFLLHDPMFDEELRRAAIYITDRKMLFLMVEAAHYRFQKREKGEKDDSIHDTEPTSKHRTIDLIDSFLNSIPKDNSRNQPQKTKRRPTPADAAVDYVAYLMESESDEERQQAASSPQLIGHTLIDSFLENENGKIVLSETTSFQPEKKDNAGETENEEIEYFTETLARIYIKQGRYSKALEIIQRLNLQYPKKNIYFADQIRFLQKLIINNNKK